MPVLIIDGAGWHVASRLVVPHNIGLLKLPPYAPELNPTENIQVGVELRDRLSSNCSPLCGGVQAACMTGIPASALASAWSAVRP